MIEVTPLTNGNANGHPAQHGQIGKPPPPVLRFSDLLGDFQAATQEAFDARVHGVRRGPGAFLPELDEILGGVYQPGFHELMGNTGTGKTAFAMQTAAESGYPAIVFTTEMHPVELFRRHIARVTRTPLHALKDGSLHPDDAMKRARRAVEAAPHMALVDATRDFVTADQIKVLARAFRDSAQSKHVLVVIDSVHTWADGMPGGASEYERLGAGVRALVSLALELNAPVLGTAERNRMSMEKAGVNAGAGSRKLEYGAESVINLDLEEGKEAPLLPPGQKPIKLKVEKNRNGAYGMTVKATFHGSYQCYEPRVG